MDRAEQKSALVADVEVTTISPVSGKEIHNSSGKKNVGTLREKVQNEKVTPWSEVSPESKLKILQSELAAGADKAVVARVAREAGLNVFADSIEKR